MIFETYIPYNERESDINKIQLISNNLVINGDWLIIKMFIESGLNPAAHNPNGDASGLIGFMPKTAISLGTSVEALREMNFYDQLDYVNKYFLPYKNQMHSYFDLSLVDFFPDALGKPDSWIFHSSDLSAQTIAKYNPTFDLNHDNEITIEEYKKYELSKVPTIALSLLMEKVSKNKNWIVPVVLFSIASALVYKFKIAKK